MTLNKLILTLLSSLVIVSCYGVKRPSVSRNVEEAGEVSNSGERASSVTSGRDVSGSAASGRAAKARRGVPRDGASGEGADAAEEGTLMPVLPKGVTEQLIVHEGYIVSYNSGLRLPNWVFYYLDRERASGTVPRESGYYPDPLVEGKQADNEDYRRSGWDRGHMVPAGDMKWSSQAMLESCYFTNICPQNNKLNGGDWRILEEKCRSLTYSYSSICISCGPIVGSGKFGTIGLNKVVIPDAFFKVLLGEKGGNIYSIGFIFPNEDCYETSVRDYACSVNDVEELTGIDFYSSLPDEAEELIESQFNLSDWKL